MRIVQLSLVFCAVLALAQTAEAKEVCRITKGEGTAIGTGSDKKTALENARFECGIKRVDQYIAYRGQIPQSVEDRYIDECANASCDR